jgi:hypothetical protein
MRGGQGPKFGDAQMFFFNTDTPGAIKRGDGLTFNTRLDLTRVTGTPHAWLTSHFFLIEAWELEW